MSHNNEAESNRADKAKITKIKQAGRKLCNFSNALSEAAPLLSILDDHSLASQDRYQKLADLLTAQRNIKNDALHHLAISELEESNNTASNYLAIQIAKFLVANEEGLMREEREVKLLTDMVGQVVATSRTITELNESMVIQGDLLGTIKCSTFPLALKIEDCLSSLNFEETDILSHILWCQNLALSLAKDIAFNWDKGAGFKQREAVFETVLKQCIDLVFEVWRKEIVASLDTPGGSNTANLQLLTPQLMMSLNEYTMGYDESDDTSLEELSQTLSETIYSEVSKVHCPTFSAKENELLKAFFIKENDQYIAHIWDEHCQGYISRIEGMTEEDRHAWLQSEGQNPMPLPKVLKRIENFLHKRIREPICIDLNLDKTAAKVKLRMSILWGVSNAVCKSSN
ncbi:hypothetical protein AB4254_11335 [Vibrio breoganii]